jgi:hypothetical protein
MLMTGLTGYAHSRATYAKPSVVKTPVQQAPLFGACVNAGTQANVFQDMLIKGSWAERYHAIASAGRASTNELAGVLVKLLSGDNELAKVINDPSNKAQKFTIMAMLENFKSGKLSEEMKAKLLESLKKAKGKKFMRDKATQEILDYAIKQMEGHHHGEPPQAYEEAQREYNKAREGHA